MKKFLIIFLIALTVSCEPEPIAEPINCDAVDEYGLIWPDGIIPYYFTEGRVELPEYTKEAVREAARIMSKETVLQIIEYPDEASIPYDNYVAIYASPFSNGTTIGMQPGRNKMVFSFTDQVYIPIHEWGHEAGLPHEQNIINRDKYIDIHYENMWDNEPTRSQYIKTEYDLFGKIPDTLSIMMYSSEKNSDNGEYTMTWKDGSTWGVNKKLSEGDKHSINEVLYKCEVK